jgi:enoyl-CoA hydratase/carnithine racemase
VIVRASACHSKARWDTSSAWKIVVTDRLRVSTGDAITEIAFDHPPINIYDVATRDALCDVLTGVIADPGVRVVVFSATGEHFSAGADLKEFGTAPSVWAMRDARWGRDVWGLLRAVEVPMLASMQGFAVGFGFELALQCDYRLAGDDCVVALPEARVGMIPAGGASQTLPRVVGTSAALSTILLSDRIRAHDALARGFVDEVVPRADLRARTHELAERIAAKPTAAVRAAKALAWAALDLPLAAGLAREHDLADLLGYI